VLIAKIFWFPQRTSALPLGDRRRECVDLVSFFASVPSPVTSTLFSKVSSYIIAGTESVECAKPSLREPRDPRIVCCHRVELLLASRGVTRFGCDSQACVLQLDKERLRDSARQGLAESYDIGRILGHGISLFLQVSIRYHSSYVSLDLAHFLTNLSPVANEYLHHTREQTLYLETNQCGDRSLRTVLIGFAQASMEANGCFTPDTGRESHNFTLEIRTVIQWQPYSWTVVSKRH
jgi:hypothetical protein